MSTLVMGLVWELPEVPEFGRPEKYVLLAYADHADSNGRNVYPSIDLIMRKTFYEERAVQVITRKLEKAGFLVPDGVGPRGTNRWLIPVARTNEGGAKIAPVQNAESKNAPEGNAPEGNAPEPSVVVNKDERFGKIANALATATGGGLGANSADMIDAWMSVHTDEWILKAIEMAKAKRARSANYVDSILIGWEANGYPQTRDQKVEGAKHANSKTGNSSRIPAQTYPVPTDADRAAAERVKARRQHGRVS
jgi:DnaD/phage-associated family protein